MTKISDLKFKARVLEEDEKSLFGDASIISTTVIDGDYPFCISVIKNESLYDIIFFDKRLNKPISLHTIVPKDLLAAFGDENKTDITLWRLDEDTANNIIDKAEEFGKNVTSYLNTIKEYSDRISMFPPTLQ